jgi:hypothetical protein
MSRRRLVCTVSYRLSTCVTWHQEVRNRVEYYRIPCTVAGRHSTAVSRQSFRIRDSCRGTTCCTINSKTNWRTWNTSFRFLRRTAHLDYGTGAVVLFRFPRTSVCYPMAGPVWLDFSCYSTKSSVFRRKENGQSPALCDVVRQEQVSQERVMPPTSRFNSGRISSMAKVQASRL